LHFETVAEATRQLALEEPHALVEFSRWQQVERGQIFPADAVELLSHREGPYIGTLLAPDVSESSTLQSRDDGLGARESDPIDLHKTWKRLLHDAGGPREQVRRRDHNAMGHAGDFPKHELIVVQVLEDHDDDRHVHRIRPERKLVSIGRTHAKGAFARAIASISREESRARTGFEPWRRDAKRPVPAP